MKNFVISILFIFLTRYLAAQTEEIKSSISGRIIDTEIHQHLPFVNMWIEGTTTGTTSDENGYYTINDVAVGRCTLSAKMISYEQASLPDITVVPKRTTIINISLQLSITQLEEVLVQ